MSSEPRHLHPAAMVIEGIRAVRGWASAAAIPGLAALLGGLSWWVLALLLLGVVSLIFGAALWGFLSWRATVYWVSGGAFHLRSGVLQKKERTIPLEHVQSVDTVQGILQRLFGVVEVRIETAGGGSSEPDAALPAVSRKAADKLRRELGGEGVEPGVEDVPVPRIIRRLSTRDLLVAGATSGQIGPAAALVGAASQFFDELYDRFLSEEAARSLLEALAPHAFAAAALLLLGVGLLAWLLAIAGTVLAYAGFTLSRSPDGRNVHISRGLLNRYEATIPVSRIQAVRVVEGVLRQPFGLASLRVESAGYGRDEGVSTTLFPMLPRREAAELLAAVDEGLAADPPLTPLPRRAFRRYVLRALLPALLAVLAAAGAWLAGAGAVWFSAVLPLPVLAVLYGALRYRDAGWALEGGRLVVRSRLVARTTSIAPRRRLQSRSVLRSPLQRRVGLATFRVRVASGGGGTGVEVVDLDLPSAWRLMDALGPSSASDRDPVPSR
ncbi:membrane protein [Rubrobacter xylanophilus]|uniref:Membrane protein n=1 Tax=Rubrobacter xylanophilus TaxID=49319 RepID=A0A510HLT3_9ACTN|nr:PH domain-containing protein [Rubrobacter xylanophilus]BBL80996.1 membrane protein [Rubrobacter xylanophilus]